MIERRKYERVIVEIKCKVFLDKKELVASILNISLGGGFLRLVSEWALDYPFENMVGRKIYIGFEGMNYPIESEVMRVYNNPDGKLLAFKIEQHPEWKKFWFRRIKT